MIRLIACAATLLTGTLAGALPGLAGATITLPLDGAEASISTARYSCAGGAPFTVQYVNAGPNSLALVPIEGEERVFVNVVSGSGARYVSGQFEWWTKGDSAQLGDEMQQGKAQDCAAAP